MQFSREWDSGWNPTHITTPLRTDWTLVAFSRRFVTPPTDRSWFSTLAPITPQGWIRPETSGTQSPTLWLRKAISPSSTVRIKVSPAGIWMRMPGQSESLSAEASLCLCVRWVMTPFGSNLPFRREGVADESRSTEFLKECGVVRRTCWRVAYGLPDVGLCV